MIGFITLIPTHPIPPIPYPQILIPSIKPLNPAFQYPNPKPPKNLKKFKTSFSENNQQLNNNDNDTKLQEEDDDLKKKGGEEDKRPRFNLKWSELLFDPDPNNVVAVGLTGVLAWASVQVLWQLFVISFAILVAAVKYSFIAALLIFILITLL